MGTFAEPCGFERPNMNPKRLLRWCGAPFSLRQVPAPSRKLKHALHALVLFAALAAMHAGALRAQWVQTNGPYGCAIYSLAFQDSVLFAATDSGIYATHDFGGSWQLSSQGLPKKRFIALAATKHELFAATDSGIFLSKDKGQSWSSIRTAQIAALTVRDSELFACGRGLWKTTDKGISWAELDTANGLESVLVDDSNIYLGGADTFLYSYDNGRTWSSTSRFDTNELTPPNFVSHVNLIALHGSTLLVNIDGNEYTGPNGVYRSLDRGRTWSLSLYSVAGLISFGSNVLASRNYGDTYVSRDGGISWSDHPSDLISGTCFAFLSNLILGGTSFDGVFLSKDSGYTWKQVSNGLSKQEYSWPLAVGSNLYAFGIERVFTSSDNGEHWLITHAFDAPESIQELGYTLVVSDSLVFLSSDEGMYYSTNQGTTWSYRVSLDVAPSQMAFMDGFLFVTDPYGDIYRSSDSGETWSGVRSGISYVQSNIVGPMITQGSKLFAGTDSGIYISTDFGTDWKESDSGFHAAFLHSGTFQANDVWSFAIIGSSIFAGTGFSGVIHSTDSGSSWSAVHSILSDTESAIIFNIGEDLFAFVYSLQPPYGTGFFLSKNEGVSWKEIDDGFPKPMSVWVSSPAVANGYLFYGSYFGRGANGIWRRPLSDFGISSISQQSAPTPLDIRSFPNPFSQSTTITFTTDAAGYADISVVNLLGVEVAHLFSGELAAGNHSFTWDADKMSAPRGVYECLVRMNGRVETVPMVRMR